MLTWPATQTAAQLFPSQPAGQPAPSERVLLDAVLWVSPPLREGLCMVLDAGKVTVTAKRVGQTIEIRPTELQFYGFMADQDAGLKVPITAQEASATTIVQGVDRYCWHINLDAPETQGMSNAQRGAYVQTIAVKLVWSPQ